MLSVTMASLTAVEDRRGTPGLTREAIVIEAEAHGLRLLPLDEKSNIHCKVFKSEAPFFEIPAIDRSQRGTCPRSPRATPYRPARCRTSRAVG